MGVGSYEREVGLATFSEEHLPILPGVWQETTEPLGGMEGFLELGTYGTLGEPPIVLVAAW